MSFEREVLKPRGNGHLCRAAGHSNTTAVYSDPTRGANKTGLSREEMSLVTLFDFFFLVFLEMLFVIS